MTLWIILTLMVVFAAVGLTIPLVRRYEARKTRGDVVDVLRDQLADIDAQTGAGGISEEEASGLRTEVKRRLLVEGRTPATTSRPLSERTLALMGFGVIAVIAIAATGLYAKLGRPDLASPPGVAAAGPAGATHPGGGDVNEMIGQLEAKLKQSPNDAQGWGMLGWSYFQTGRYGEAAVAYGRAAALDPNDSEHLSAQGEALVRAAGQQVTPEALTAFRKAVAVDPGDPRARYFLGVAKDQHGDHSGAMDDWIGLLKTAPEGAPWAAEVRGFVERVARERGEDISGRLPPVSVASTAPAAVSAGPNAAQVASANQMSDADRQKMIAGMVDSLAARLKTSPRDGEGWVRLMRARMVLGQTDQAAAALRDGQKAFVGSPSDQAKLREAAKGLGVPGA